MTSIATADRGNEKIQFDSFLKPFQARIIEQIGKNMALLHNNGILREACEYALLNGGKRFRPALVLMIADALRSENDVSSAALAVEYFHTASLVADDLPCMDDDDERRNKPSVHKVYGEAIALLASYALIAEGFAGISTCVNALKKKNYHSRASWDAIGMLALENASFNTGLQGATGGQFLDIFPPDLALASLREILHKKTVSLFEISFVFGWLFGGGNPEALPAVKQAASHFGMAFQIADDLGDVEQDAANGRKVNVANVFGIKAAQQMFHEEIRGYRETLKILGLTSKEMQDLATYLETLAGVGVIY